MNNNNISYDYNFLRNCLTLFNFSDRFISSFEKLHSTNKNNTYLVNGLYNQILGYLYAIKDTCNDNTKLKFVNSLIDYIILNFE